MKLQKDIMKVLLTIYKPKAVFITCYTRREHIIASKELALLFTKDTITIDIASKYLILVGIAQIPLALTFVFSASLRGAGATKTVMKINILSLWFFRVIPSYIAYKLGFSVLTIFIIMNIETFIKGLIYSYIYTRKKWLHIKV